MIAGLKVVLVCGSRGIHAESYNPVRDVLLESGRCIFLSGDCPEGADYWVLELAKTFKQPRLAIPADWDTHGKQAGFIRNAQMVELADECIAVWDGKSKGTAHTIELCRKKGIPVRIIEVKS